MNNAEKANPFTLVVDNTVRDRTLARFSHLSHSVWAHKPREIAMAERHYLLLHSVRVEGVPRISSDVLHAVWKLMRTGEGNEATEEAIHMADHRANEMRRIMAECLRNPYWESVFRTSRITPEIRERLHDMLVRFSLHFSVLSGEIGELSDEGQRHVLSKMREVYEEIARAVREIAGHVVTREEIERHLAEKGYDVCDETVVKLLIYETNRGSTDPQFLALPAYHPYNPLICAVEYDGGTFPELRAILSLFAFLDEYPS